MSLIHIENASKYYTMGEETIKALDDVSLDIDHGEFRQIHTDEHHRVLGYCR
ncbi:hypothetical protein [Paenibacillus alginolyticus]|uniref:hypothetical protein n=1 Tax=Paenibacillus alginolyticus TaxID=59839 RepID=UPI00040C625C